MIQLAPSILSADFSRLGEDVKKIETAGAHLIHVDVMDGHFVPNISYGATVMKSLCGKTQMPFDVHLMIENPDQYIGDFVTDQTEYITVHQEACPHINRTLPGRQTGSRYQSGNAGFRTGLCAGRCGSDPGDVGQSGIRRTEVHPISSPQGAGIKGAAGKARSELPH